MLALLSVSSVYSIRWSDINATHLPVFDIDQARNMPPVTLESSDEGCELNLENMTERYAMLPRNYQAFTSANTTQISDSEFLYECWDLRQDMQPTDPNDPEHRRLGWWKGRCAPGRRLVLRTIHFPYVIPYLDVRPFAITLDADIADCQLPPRRPAPRVMCHDTTIDPERRAVMYIDHAGMRSAAN